MWHRALPYVVSQETEAGEAADAIGLSVGREQHEGGVRPGEVPVCPLLRTMQQGPSTAAVDKWLGRVVEIDPWSRIPERRHALLNFDP